MSDRTKNGKFKGLSSLKKKVWFFFGCFFFFFNPKQFFKGANRGEVLSRHRFGCSCL